MSIRSLVRRLLAEPGTIDLDIDAAVTSSERKRLVLSKSFLRSVYDQWYAWLHAAQLSSEGPSLEIGAGGGFLKSRVPGTIASDILAISGIDVVLDASALPFEKASLRSVVMTNVMHHLPDIRAFLGEAQRCVKPGGAVVMVEPWVTRWSTWIYRSFHHEVFDPQATTWGVAPGGPLSEANGALPWIVFERDRARFAADFPSLKIVSIRPVMPILYLLSGGVSMRALTPAWTFRSWRRFDAWLVNRFPGLAMFAVILLER